MELREALIQITEIRAQMARTEVFRGYRALPVAITGLLAVAASGLQGALIADPSAQVDAYLTLWVATAGLSAAAAGAGMWLRRRGLQTSLGREVTWMAVEQFMPCLVAGGLLTAVLAKTAPGSLWLLPGLWQLFFSLGVFASCRLLPRATVAVALFYLAAGGASLALARGEHAFSPWAMGVPFGVGQLLAAAVLYWNLERNDGDL